MIDWFDFGAPLILDLMYGLNSEDFIGSRVRDKEFFGGPQKVYDIGANFHWFIIPGHQVDAYSYNSISNTCARSMEHFIPYS